MGELLRDLGVWFALLIFYPEALMRNARRRSTTPSRRATPPTRVWRAHEAAAYVGESLANLYKLVAAGVIPHFRQGERSIRFDRVALDAWLDEKRDATKGHVAD